MSLCCGALSVQKNPNQTPHRFFSVNKSLALAGLKSVFSQTSSYALDQENGIVNAGHHGNLVISICSATWAMALRVWGVLEQHSYSKMLSNKYWSYFSVPV